ncbi:hypothetical protein NMG60_11035945 [Bertholletia excelsa]
MAFPRTAAKGTAGMAVGLLALFIICASQVCDARELTTASLPGSEIVTDEVSVVHMNYEEPEESKASKEGGKNENICVLCEEFAAEAIRYLEDNQTQTEIIQTLHKSCSRLLSFKQQCITLVDYYVPLLFAEVELLQPEEFCQKINLCEQRLIASRPRSDNKCEICEEVIAEVILKLKDPDTQLEIIEYLLKACDAVQSYLKKCKRMVLEYGPLILADAEKFLEKTDICVAIHACDSPSSGASGNQTSMVENTPLHSVS